MNNWILNATQTSDGTTSHSSSSEHLAYMLKLTKQIYVALFFILNPTIGVVGLISNTLGSVVLVKDGLHKSSTIFMLALTVADSMCLVGAISPAKFLELHIENDFTLSVVGWAYSYDVAFFLFILMHIISFCANMGIAISLTLPPVISIERFVAVYFPLKFKQIMTTKTVKVLVFAVCLFWLPWIVFYSTCTTFHYVPSGIGLAIPTLFCFIHYEKIAFFNYYIFNYLTSICPLIIVVTGAVLITVKIQLTAHNRKKVSTSKNLSVQRTTKTLVVVSLINTLVNFVYFLVVTLTADLMVTNTIAEVLIMKCLSTLLYIGNASNIYVCIFLNKKYTSMLFELLGLRKKHE